jgi:metallophosphoesterase (TIGR00282 family)
VAVVNLMGSLYIGAGVSPFRIIDDLVAQASELAATVVVDFHAEATSEKVALGYYLDGKVAAVVGTHTHVQTADARVLPKGTAYITDVGMTGPVDSVIGVKTEIILRRFLTEMPMPFEVADGQVRINAVVIEIRNGRAVAIERLEEFV